MSNDAGAIEPEARPPAAEPQIVVVGPRGMAVSRAADGGESRGDDDDGDSSITDLVNQPAKVMRIGNMIRQLLEEGVPGRRRSTRPPARGSRRFIRRRSRSSRAGWRPNSSTNSSASACRSPTQKCRANRSCGSHRRSSSAGSKDSSTASRPPSSSRWPRTRSSSTCAGRYPRARASRASGRRLGCTPDHDGPWMGLIF